MKKHLPNTITCCNLLCGAVATYLATQGLFTPALGFILLGAIFDFLDGATARLLGVSSPIGKELDSLADAITFGLAPAMMLASSIRLATEYSTYEWGNWSLLALVMAAFSAVRLAKFNCDERQTSSFIGLATPANALFWASLIATFPDMPSWGQAFPFAMMAAAACSCYLLIAELPMFSLKLHNFQWKENSTRFIFLIGCVLLIAICALLGKVLLSGTACIVWYVIAALIDFLKR